MTGSSLSGWNRNKPFLVQGSVLAGDDGDDVFCGKLSIFGRNVSNWLTLVTEYTVSGIE